MEVLEELECWLKGKPQLREADLETNTLTPETTMLMLQYHACVVMAVRPPTLRALEQKLRISSEANSLRIDSLTQPISYAVGAACATVRTLRRHAAARGLAVYGFLDGEQAFSASQLLIMTNAAVPSLQISQSIITYSLNVLAHIAERGNDDTRQQMESLIRL
ncbi:hypothetical protein M409DRAFT_30076 [Zasmidium cellare ATCC 36951]|uniref:Uncharacterized protein n=1 Tax=Zasmidium cellare ATCC 36951 TaxID=1080233 RepID=A0A6A6BZM8_ZASCE|nr:uncharacterized protein M409DRAFT_30076 [Zasmidium cellare ATCC 36951]KAF2159458.1 hypothetical protein M409DRAFT_30076 [Zasmidium cellare ATCC 36951]